jgi:mRNA interferase MazF
LTSLLFKGIRQTEQRPVIVGNELALDADVIIAPVNSQQPRNQLDVILAYWREVYFTIESPK